MHIPEQPRQGNPDRYPTKHTLAALVAIRRRFATKFVPSPWIFWGDFLLSIGLGWFTFFSAATIPLASTPYILITGLSILAFLRAAIFIHEIAHLKRGALPGFEIAWNLFVGLPFLLPSLMYDSHGDHHRNTTFGTVRDPEYAPIASWGHLRIGGFVVSSVCIPLLLAFRWGFVGPLSFLMSPLRRVVLERGSSLIINPSYRCPPPQKREARRWVRQEVATVLTFWTIIVLAYPGWIPLRWLGQWYVISAGVLLLNQIRTLAAHRYTNEGQQLTTVEQLLDSVNLTGWPLPTVLAAPLGLRYHALHHFLPTVPYHSLGALHRRLIAELPLDSPYRLTEERGIFAAIFTLLRQSGIVPSLEAEAVTAPPASKEA
ncbi:MAG: fatty acid desaturase [Candidatus Binatia bacterium]